MIVLVNYIGANGDVCVARRILSDRFYDTLPYERIEDVVTLCMSSLTEHIRKSWTSIEIKDEEGRDVISGISRERKPWIQGACV